jgi:hypothetical protein
MLCNVLTVVVTAVIICTLAVSSADAVKKGKRSRSQTTATTNASPSLDGRTLGRMRTCGFDYLQYDGLGAPTGPYCH